jgi:hypothetical protein
MTWALMVPSIPVISGLMKFEDVRSLIHVQK